MDATRRNALCALVGASAAGWTGAALADEGPALATTPEDRPHLARPHAAGARRRIPADICSSAGVKKIAKISRQSRRADDDAQDRRRGASSWSSPTGTSIDAIKGYAGATYEHVHDLPRDEEFFIDKEKLVRHFELDVNFWQG